MDDKIPISAYVRPKSLMENVPISDAAKHMLLRRDEDPKLIALLTCHAKLFDVGTETERKEYEALLTEAANNRMEIKWVSRHWSDEKQTVFVYMEWGTHLIDRG